MRKNPKRRKSESIGKELKGSDRKQICQLMKKTNELVRKLKQERVINDERCKKNEKKEDT